MGASLRKPCSNTLTHRGCNRQVKKKPRSWLKAELIVNSIPTFKSHILAGLLSFSYYYARIPETVNFSFQINENDRYGCHCQLKDLVSQDYIDYQNGRDHFQFFGQPVDPLGTVPYVKDAF